MRLARRGALQSGSLDPTDQCPAAPPSLSVRYRPGSQARKANEKAVVVERRREARGGNVAVEPSTRKWYEDKKKQQEAELEQIGLSSSDAYLLETAETAAAKLEKKRKKPTTSGWCGKKEGFSSSTTEGNARRWARSRGTIVGARLLFRQKETWNPPVQTTFRLPSAGVVLESSALSYAFFPSSPPPFFAPFAALQGRVRPRSSLPRVRKTRGLIAAHRRGHAARQRGPAAHRRPTARFSIWPRSHGG